MTKKIVIVFESELFICFYFKNIEFSSFEFFSFLLCLCIFALSKNLEFKIN